MSIEGTAARQPTADAPVVRGIGPRTFGFRLVLGGSAFLLAVVLWAVVWYETQVHAGPPGASTVVAVPEGTGLGALSATLARDKVISSSLALRVYFLFHGSPVVRSGEYSLRRGESLATLTAALISGPNVIDIPAGFAVWETAERVAQFSGHSEAHFNALVQDRTVVSPYEPSGTGNLDGLLGVGRYVLKPGESDQELLGQMVARFDSEAQSAGLDAGAQRLGITPYQAVIVSSIVQKEGVFPQNIAKVSRVIYNRLARGMRLQMDSTVLYAERRDGGSVAPADLALDTPYNTYLYGGLTPTPVSFPSPAALAAALNPAEGDWLYFVVVSKDGTEAFSDTYAGQLANEKLAASRGLG